MLTHVAGTCGMISSAAKFLLSHNYIEALCRWSGIKLMHLRDAAG
jgi:hypothetical protein